MNNSTPNPAEPANHNISSFRNAAECLAQAATSLSAAAQAMSIAAEAFSVACPDIEILQGFSLALRSKELEPIKPVEDDDLFCDIEPIDQEMSTPDSGVEEAIDDTYTDYYFSDEDEDYIHALLRRQEEDKIRRGSFTEGSLQEQSIMDRAPSVQTQYSNAASTSFPNNATSAQPTHRLGTRILVDLESDVLPIVCALFERFDKVLCYMHFPLHSIPMYQKLMKDITNGAFVGWMTNSPPDWVLSGFEKRKKAIMLMHDTFTTPPVISDAKDLCIIHFGWPRGYQRYTTQLNVQGVSSSIVVAYSGDRNIYPTCSKVVSKTTPWPDHDRMQLLNRANVLKPRLEKAIARIPPTIKGNAYIHWIEKHSRGGYRYVSSWSPSMLVKRANAYVLDVLRYGAEGSNSNTTRFDPPSVSTEFVKRNGLESAVKEGLLRLAKQDPEMNAASDVPNPLAAEVPQRCSFVLRDEFDMLPVARALVAEHDKVVFYATSSIASLAFIKKMIGGATSTDIISIDSSSPAEVARATKDFDGKKRAVLLLTEDVLPGVNVSSVGNSCVIHIGWPENYSKYMLQTSRAGTSIVVACMQDIDMLPSGLAVSNQTAAYPKRSQVEAQRLPGAREEIKTLLAHESKTSKERLYMEWIEAHGIHGRRRASSWTVTTLAIRANDYLSNTLRYHTTGSGTGLLETLPPLWSGFVEKNGLQKAVEAGVLRVVSPTPVSETDKGNSRATAPGVSTATFSSDDISEKPDVPNVPPASMGEESSSIPTAVQIVYKENAVYKSEFEVIPSICQLTRSKTQQKTVCFVKEIGVYSALAPLISAMISKPVVGVVSSASDVLASITNALESPSGCLIFCSSFSPLLYQLRNQTFVQSIHVGWADTLDLHKDHTRIKSLTRSSVLFHTSEFSSLAPSVVEQIKSQGFLAHTVSSSGLKIQGDQWRQHLSTASGKILRRCYMEWIMHYYEGSQKVKHWTAVDVVTQANNFARNILLRGNAKPGTQTMLGGPLSVSPGVAKHLKLKAAVDAKLLKVET